MRIRKGEELKSHDKILLKEINKHIEENYNSNSDPMAIGPVNQKEVTRIYNRHIEEVDHELLNEKIKQVKKTDPKYRITKNKNLYLKFFIVNLLVDLPQKIDRSKFDYSLPQNRFISRRFA